MPPRRDLDRAAPPAGDAPDVPRLLGEDARRGPAVDYAGRVEDLPGPRSGARAGPGGPPRVGVTFDGGPDLADPGSGRGGASGGRVR